MSCSLALNSWAYWPTAKEHGSERVWEVKGVWNKPKFTSHNKPKFTSHTTDYVWSACGHFFWHRYLMKVFLQYIQIYTYLNAGIWHSNCLTYWPNVGDCESKTLKESVISMNKRQGVINVSSNMIINLCHWVAPWCNDYNSGLSHQWSMFESWWD